MYLKSSHVPRISSVLQTILIAFQKEFQKIPTRSKQAKRKTYCITLLGKEQFLCNLCIHQTNYASNFVCRNHMSRTISPRNPITLPLWFSNKRLVQIEKEKMSILVAANCLIEKYRIEHYDGYGVISVGLLSCLITFCNFH